MILNLGGEEVVVVSSGTTTNDYSTQPQESWVDADTTKRTVMTTAPPEPRPSEEPVSDARNAVTSGWTLCLPAGDPVTRADRVRVRGVDYPVQGEPARWEHSTIVQVFGTDG